MTTALTPEQKRRRDLIERTMWEGVANGLLEETGETKFGRDGVLLKVYRATSLGRALATQGKASAVIATVAADDADDVSASPC
jgi:hypothetical protein